MKKFILLVAVFLSLIILPPVQGIQLVDGLYFAIPPESITCVDIQLPDAAGVYLPGAVEFEIRSDAIWGDLTEQLVTTDENNSVSVPICFNSFNKANGTCAPEHTILITVDELELTKTFSGGTCVNSLEGLNIVPEGGDPGSVINSNADLFDLAFKTQTIYADSLENTTFSLLIQSYAELTLELTAVGLNPTTQTIFLSESNPKETVDFTPTKEGEVSVTAKIVDCEASFCDKTAVGSAFLSESPNTAGFTVSLFPLSMNVEKLEPVKYELTLENYGEDSDFEISLILEEGLDSGFQTQVVTLEKNEVKTVEFEVTPQDPASFYELKAVITSGGNTKQRSAYLSTNELLTDALRLGEDVKSSNPDAAAFVDNEIDNWYESYKSETYGSGIGDYVNLKESLEAARSVTEDDQQQENLTVVLPLPQEQEGSLILTNSFIYIIITGVIVVAILAFFFMKKKGKKELDLPELEE